MPSTLAEAQARLTQMVDEHLRDDAQRQLEDLTAPITWDHRERADLTEHRLFRAASALVAAGTPENDPQVTQLLSTLLNIGSAHINGFRARGPRRARLYRLYNLGSISSRNTSTAAKDAETIRALENSVRTIARHLSNLKLGVESSLLSYIAEQVRERATNEQTNALIGHLLADGDPTLAARVAAKSLRFDGADASQITEAQLSRFGALARAHAAIGSTGPFRSYAMMMLEPRYANEADLELERYEMYRARNGAADHMITLAERVRAERADSADAAITTAHGILRRPKLMDVAPPSSGQTLRANVTVSARAFSELVARFADTPAWGGIEPMYLTPATWRANATATRGPRPHDLAEPQARHVQLGAGASLRARVDGVNVQVRFVLAMEDSPLRSDTTRAQRVRELLRESVGDQIAERCAPAAQEWSGLHMDIDETARADRGPVLSGRRELLGEERCDHPGATWVVQSAWRARNALHYGRLACRRCMRSQVAAVPMHRLTSPSSLSENHMVAMRAQAAFDGDPLPADMTLEQLIERDREISVDPGDYAIVPSARHTPPARTRGLGRRR